MQGEFYTYPAPNFEWEHDMSPPSSEFMNLRYKNSRKNKYCSATSSKTTSSSMASG